ncbi:MAG: mycofactocin precursor MftA [Sporichthyaceae bacterium]
MIEPTPTEETVEIAVDDVAQDLLVEDVSIDGMCGVY